MQNEIVIDHGDGRHNHAGDSGPTAKPRASTPKVETQMVIQLNVYRDAYGRYEYLLLKRIDEDVKFWQVITEAVPDSDTLIDTMRRAADEQAGIRSFRHLSHEMYSYEWYAGGERGRDIVFAAEVAPDLAITPDGSRYDDYRWLPADEAVQLLKWSGNKQALRQLDEHLRAKRLEMPATVTTGFYGNGSSRVAGPIAQSPGQVTDRPEAVTAVAGGTAAHNPYGDHAPKRLPDVPEQGIDELKPYPEEDDERTGEWFL